MVKQVVVEKDLYVNRYIREYLNWLETELDTPITMLGTGAENKSLILRRNNKPLLKEL